VSVFSVGHAPISTAFGAVLAPLVGILSLAVVYWVIKGTDERMHAADPHPRTESLR